MMFSHSWFWSFIDHTSTLKLHGVFGDEPKEDPRWSHQPALMMSNSMMMEQQMKAVIENVRRSLKGLRNEAPSLLRMKQNVPPSLFNQRNWSQNQNNEAWRLKSRRL